MRGCTNWAGHDGDGGSRRRYDARCSAYAGRRRAVANRGVERSREPDELRRPCLPRVLRRRPRPRDAPHARRPPRWVRRRGRGTTRADGVAHSGDARLRALGDGAQGAATMTARIVILTLTRVEADHLAGLARQFIDLL